MAKLLIVEDDFDIAMPLQIFLEIEGHQVRSAGDGQAGLQAVDEGFPDVILMDVEMPRLTGPEMAYRLLIEDAGREQIPIVILSGVNSLDEVAKRVGTPYYLSKPFSFEELSQLLERALIEKRYPNPDLSQRVA